MIRYGIRPVLLRISAFVLSDRNEQRYYAVQHAACRSKTMLCSNLDRNLEKCDKYLGRLHTVAILFVNRYQRQTAFCMEALVRRGSFREISFWLPVVFTCFAGGR